MEWPKMMYLHDGSLAYKVVESRAEAEEYKAKGYVFERWGAKPKKEPLPMPRTDPPKAPPKKSHKKKPSPKITVRRDFDASKIKETTENDGNSGAQPGKTLEGEQGIG